MACSKVEPLHERNPNFVSVVGGWIALIVDEVDRFLKANSVLKFDVAKAFLAPEDADCGLGQIEVL